MDSVPEVKIVTLGEGRVGKTSLALKFVKNQFHEREISTTTANFLQKELFIDGTMIRLNIWDTAGQERYRALAPNYYRQAKGAVIVYDITDRQSFQKVMDWTEELQAHGDKHMSIVIVGNKVDKESERQVSRNEPLEYAMKIGARHIGTSAKTGEGVVECFMQIAKSVYKRRSTVVSKPYARNRTVSIIKDSGKKKWRC